MGAHQNGNGSSHSVHKHRDPRAELFGTFLVDRMSTKSKAPSPPKQHIFRLTPPPHPYVVDINVTAPRTRVTPCPPPELPDR